MKKTLLLTLIVAALLTFLCGTAHAEREPRDVKYYFLVSVTDCSSDLPVRRSCENSNGYIKMSTVRQDGSTGPTWSARVDYADWDHENATVWYYLGCEKGSTIKPTQLDESCAIDAFPTLIWLRGAKTGENTFGYIWNLNSTYASTEKITLWVSSTGYNFVEVQSWEQTAFAALDEFDEDMEVAEENLPTPTWIRGISGPTTIPIPQLNHSDEKDQFFAELDDQYGNQWRAGTNKVLFDLAESHTGISIGKSNGVITTSPDAASLDSGVTSFRVLVRARWITDLLYPDKAVGMYVDFVYPKYILMYYSEGTGVGIYETYYGTTWTHPDDIPAQKKSDDNYHYNLTGWGTPPSVVVTGDMNFTANYQAEPHDWVPDSSHTHLICSKCRRSKLINPLSYSLSGSGEANNPYLIRSESDWNIVANFCQEGGETAQKYFCLINDISVSTMIGTEANPFGGAFDGDGHTLTVNLTTSEQYAAPLRYVSGASFTGLRVAGTINTSARGASGLVGCAQGNCTITDSVSDIQIVATDSGEHAGFVSNCVGGTVTVTGSVFTGSITGANANYCAGFLGWQGDAVDDCVYDGTMNDGNNSNNFIRTSSYADNSYYLNTDGVERIKGKQGWAVTTGDGVTLDFGAWVYAYPTSGITVYKTGLMYKGVFYAGPGQTIALRLAGASPEGMLVSSFTASAGTLTRNGDVWTLTLPNEDVVISAVMLPAFGTPDFTLPSYLTAIEEEAFEGAAMAVVDVPANCVSIGNHAFRACTKLTQIRIPSGCAMGKDVFDGCTLVYVYGAEGSPAETYCRDPAHSNCVFVLQN